MKKSNKSKPEKNLWPVPKPRHQGQAMVKILPIRQTEQEGEADSNKINRDSSQATPWAGNRGQEATTEVHNGRRRTGKRRNKKLHPKGTTTQELTLKDAVEEVVAPKEIKAVPTTQVGEEEEEGISKPNKARQPFSKHLCTENTHF